LRILAICFILQAAGFGPASAQIATTHKKALPAHVHGGAKLNIAIEGKDATIQLETPADGIVGFEHAAVTAADKKQQSAGLDTLKNRIAEMVIFDRSAACTFTARKVAVEKDPGEDHADVNAEFGVTCGKPPAGTTLRFGFSKIFPRIVDVEVQLLSGSQQTGAKIHNDEGTIALSR
jgi:hypothetical protein